MRVCVYACVKVCVCVLFLTPCAMRVYVAGVTPSQYTLEVLEIFEADRAGERDRFEPWNKLHNHQLLW